MDLTHPVRIFHFWNLTIVRSRQGESFDPAGNVKGIVIGYCLATRLTRTIMELYCDTPL